MIQSKYFHTLTTTAGEAPYSHADSTTQKIAQELFYLTKSTQGKGHIIVCNRPRGGKSYLVQCAAEYALKDKTQSTLFVWFNADKATMSSTSDVIQDFEDMVRKTGLSYQEVVVVSEVYSLKSIFAEYGIPTSIIFELTTLEYNNIASRGLNKNTTLFNALEYAYYYYDVKKLLGNHIIYNENLYCDNGVDVDKLLDSVLEVGYDIAKADLENDVSPLQPGEWVECFSIIASIAGVEMRDMMDDYPLRDFVANCFNQVRILQPFKDILNHYDFINREGQAPTDEYGALEYNSAPSKNYSPPRNKKDEVANIEFNNYQDVHRILSSRIIGQDSAIQEIMDSLAIPMANMNRKTKPLRTMMFLGATGVGKTKISELLAENLYTSPVPLVRIDMGEYQEKQDTNKLLGSPPGYIGYGTDGKLVQAVKNNPYSIVLLDEVEKAHRQVFDTFLAVYDNGTLTTGSGEVVDFTKTIVIMTSNLGTEELSKPRYGFGEASTLNTKSVLKSALESFFRPEFLNRINNIIYFNNLTSNDVKTIIDMEMKEVQKMFPHDYRIVLDDNVYDQLASLSDINRYGARNIQKMIDDTILSPISKSILDNPNVDSFEVLVSDGDIMVR